MRVAPQCSLQENVRWVRGTDPPHVHNSPVQLVQTTRSLFLWTDPVVPQGRTSPLRVRVGGARGELLRGQRQGRKEKEWVCPVQRWSH